MDLLTKIDKLIDYKESDQLREFSMAEMKKLDNTTIIINNSLYTKSLQLDYNTKNRYSNIYIIEKLRIYTYYFLMLFFQGIVFS